MKNTPIVTITCNRDLPMLDLQAQSIHQYLDKACPVYIVVNEDDCAHWFKEFEQYKKYYQNHKLTVITKQDFLKDWKHWIPNEKNPWAVGWEIQQVLKIAVAKLIDSKQFLVLDTQNFLIKEWSPSQYGYINEKIPARAGKFVMPDNIWSQYSNSLGFSTVPSEKDLMSICTPIFLSKKICDSLIENRGGIEKFANWFKTASNVKSEFILYNLWAEHQGGFWTHHYIIPEIEDWANPYLRDCRSEDEFLDFFNFLGMHRPHSWASINHRAWGNMSGDQYRRLLRKLKTFNLIPNFDQYRSTYVDIKI